MNISRKTGYSFDGYECNVTNMITPNECPMCHHKIEPNFMFLGRVSDTIAQVIFHCNGCSNLFISTYSGSPRLSSSTRYLEVSTLVKSEPTSFLRKSFDPSINELSPKFVEIYNQALCAENFQLNEIAGIGYRKSLEFLIKDFCINQNKDKESTIIDPKYSLSSCINDFISDPKLKNVSKISSWIGNDETHYTRVHSDKDVKDLKTYVEATVYFVTYNLLADEASRLVSGS